MAPADMIHTGPPLSAAQPATPPSSPNQLSPVTLNNVQQFIDMVKEVVVREIASTAPASKIECPDHQTSTQPITIQDLEKLFLKLIDTKSDSATEISQAPQPNSSQPKAVAQASLLAFKEVNEVWDIKAYKYTVVESPKPKEISGLGQYVFVVRGRVDKKSEQTTYYIDINSLTLRDALRNVLHDVAGISIKEEKLSVERNILYNFLPEIESCRNWNEIDPLDQTSHEHIQLLIDYIKSSYADTTQRLNVLLGSKEITYDLLWVLFKPNTLVYTTCEGTKKPRCIRYESGEAETTPNGLEYFHIKGNYVEFDGKVLGKVPVQTAILSFRGSKSISTLEAFPLLHHLTRETVQEELTECGRKFCSLVGVSHREYKGRAFQMEKGKAVEISVNSRIIVDPAMFQEVNPNYARPSVFKRSGSIDIWELMLNDDPSTQLDESTLKKSVDLDRLDAEDLLICSPTVLGFSLEDHLWLEFAVANISDISWNESIFNQLAIPPKSKTLIQALTTEHLMQEKICIFDDFVKGKGRGLNILLYGPPGVGKTMTAEALSELLRKALFTVSAANLSHDPATLDKQLAEIFELASHWNALLLLDEADAFLRQRSENHQHNTLVAVFLRKLEYFQGIMLLTTNRVRDFDHAIQSRIHIGISYQPLGYNTRKMIWDNFLTKTEGVVISYSAKELEHLATQNLNGRQWKPKKVRLIIDVSPQIKNTVRAANALANHSKTSLSITHIQTVLDIGKVFENDFKGTGRTDNMGAYF
ncbi:hypothetical protein HYALB_00014000 [Hymenoscyphus albidus]|uniref:AAA+ ATPase domain-containing protein n=1 Tax=Hymenoscyphus albidus TaxID=595503 RepID=A0A9N9LVW1_9HELO|nr:hypothetical protein HYALB_00014000 [Hymenoscyphus albidus]